MFNKEELIGMNISRLMPKIFENKHQTFMQNFYQIGEKKLLITKTLKHMLKIRTIQ